MRTLDQLCQGDVAGPGEEERATGEVGSVLVEASCLPDRISTTPPSCMSTRDSA